MEAGPALEHSAPLLMGLSLSPTTFLMVPFTMCTIVPHPPWHMRQTALNVSTISLSFDSARGSCVGTAIDGPPGLESPADFMFHVRRQKATLGRESLSRTTTVGRSRR